MGHFQFKSGPAAPYPDVQVIEGGGSHPHLDLPGPRFRFRNVSILNNIQLSMLLKI
jgi:hypothetical protein